jgi:hypothetical protein
MRKFLKLALSVILLAFTQQVSKAQTTLAAGDIAFTGYLGFGASATTDEFSFVLLAPVTAGTVINFTDNGWLSTNVFRTGETTVTWTAATALPAGTEVKIVGTTPTLAGAGNPGTVTGTALSLSANGDQVLAYQGSAASPTFISAIHMNVYSTTNSDPVTTTAAAWDGTANTANASALPTGLTTGNNAIWIGTQGDISSEKDNARFVCAGNLTTVASIKGLIYNQANWTTSDGDPAGFLLPTGCSYISAAAAPTINTQPGNSTICAGANTSFSITATGAVTFQWQVDNGGGFANITNDATYSGATTTTLNITAAPFSFNGYQYRCVATNGTGPTNSNAAVLTITPLPTGPTLLAKTPATATVADGTPVSATFNAGSGGTGCSDDFRYTTNGGASYLPYTPGSNISTTGLAAGTGVVTIEGRRANCSAGCQGNYVALATWIVTPLPAGATTLNAGDIAFSSYAAVTDAFSFVLLRNIGSGTAINFTNNGWLSTNVFRTGEETVTWTSNAAYSAGTEIRITGLTASLALGGSAGTVTGTAITLNINGDQILAYRGTAASPTFISAIHMNVFSTSAGDAVNTTAAAWDGTANSVNASALPTGLTTGTNAIWIGTQGVPASEFDNSRYGNCAGPGTLGPIATLRAALNNQINWISNNNSPTPGFAIPTGCNYLGIGTPPNIIGPVPNSTICAGSNATFTMSVTGATDYQWQVNTGSGFNNITDDAIYSGTATPALLILAAPFGFNGYQYRCIASNGSGSSTSNAATLTVDEVPTAPSLASKTPAAVTVADGTPVSATFNAGSGGTGCADDFRYTTDGGATYLPYTPGANISTTGLAAGSGWIFIQGRRANCTSGCSGVYITLASWYVTPLPTGATTLNAGDIGFTGYTSTTAASDFSFVLLRNVGPGTAINFTDNGWLSTNVFRTGETTVTWTAPAGGLTAGTEITIAGLTATKAGGGAAGTVTGTALNLSQVGDQILAYRGTAAAPTFISAIHMNVYTTANGDPTTTSAGAWDGAANTASASALPTGLTTSVNAIWIGTPGNVASEFMNARYGNCGAPGIAGPFTSLRTALNNQANWVRNNNTPPGFTLPVNCNYFGLQAPVINHAAAFTAFSSCAGTASTEQNFTVSGNNLTTGIVITAPTGFEVSTTSGSGFATTLTLPPSGGAVANTTIYVRLAASATGTPSGNITLASTGVTTVNVAVSGTVNPLPPTPIITPGGPTTFCTGGSVTLTSSSATGNLWSTSETTQAITATTAGTYTVTVTSGGCTSAPSAGITVTVNPIPPAPTITPGGPTTFCTGGSVTLTSSSATGNFWSTLETTQSITVTTAGAYTVTVTSAGCTSAPSAAVTVTLEPLPTTANAGPDATACVNPGTFTMAANAPTVGTGVWSQAPGGPSTAIIFTPGSATSNIGGLTTAGTYTFVWTISNGTCTPSRDTMTITVNPNPAPFTLAGGGTFCPGTTTLTGPVDPNFTYTWQRSLSGIANPNSFTTFGGTAQTQAVTSSGNYRLVVTNQFGCTASDTAAVSMADFVFNGSLATGDLQQNGRLNRFAAVSTCAAPKACPGTFTTTGARLYDAYTITNPRNVPVCATIGIASGCGVNMFSVAYSGSYDPNSLCTNYLADPGSSFPNVGYYEATIPANGTIVVVVHEVNTGAGCASYQLTVDVPRETAGIAVTPVPPICSGTPVNLAASTANTYLWTPGGATTQSIAATPTVASTFKVNLGYGNAGCIDSATTTVTIVPPATTFAGNDTATCGTTITLAATNAAPGTGTWSQVSGPGTANFSNANSPTSSVTVSANGVYRFRWNVVTLAPCASDVSDSINVNFAANPSTANAGTDKTACVSPGSVAMTATAPVTGTGVWTQVAGPTTATIVNATSPTTNITNLASTGTYTFRWTVSNNPCTSNFDEVNVVVNGNPAPFTVTGGGTFCPGTTTLSGPANPNFTYVWERSLSGIANPNSFTTFGGTAQTQAVTSSGNYRLIVTNQFGCTASDTASVSMADFVFNGSLATGDLQQPGRLNRFGVVSTCAAPKACPNTFTTTGARLYDAYTITNPRNVPVCATIGIASGCGVNMFSVAYSGSYDPNSLCTNYLADPGSSFPNVGYYEATIPANGTIVVVVHEVNTGTGCASYQLTVDVPRDGAPIVVNPPTVTCASTATLTAPVANSYLWTPGGATTQSITTPPLFVDTKYNVTLGYGNAGCTRLDSVTVTVTSLPPTITCPANTTLANTSGQCSRAVTYSTTVTGLPAPTLSYSFSGATTGSGAGNGSGSVFNVGTTTVTVTATNACGSVNCSFTVTITDSQPPTVTTGTIASCYPTVAAAQAAALAATSATDNCPGTLTETASTVGTCSAVVTVRTTDVAGNFTDVTYNTRIDNTPPTVTAGTIASCYPTVAAAEAAALAATSATDNCPGALTEVASTVGTCSAVITVTTSDACGNSTSVTYNTRIDNTPPTVTAGTIGSCYPTVAAAEAAALAATSATDNCPGALTEVASTVGTCSAVITVTTSDACGNSTSVTYNTRIDNTPPTVTAGTIGSCYPTVAAAEAAALAATSATDNCPGALTEVASTVGTCSAVVTVTTTDGCGNSTSVTYNTRIDNTPPTLTCPGPITVCGPGGVPAANIASVTGVTDNCPGTVTVTHVGDVANSPSTIVTYTITRTYRATDVCGNFTECTQTITVNPIPVVDAVGNQVLCNTFSTTAVNFTSAVSGTSFAWTNDNTSIGLAANGSGNIPSFTATNTGNAPVTATISIIGTANGCPGPVRTFTITVNPTPTVNFVSSQTVCNGLPTSIVNFTGAVTGTTYNWSNSNPSIGLAATGTGTINSFNAINTGILPVTAIITVTPVANGCTGASRTFTITVNPTPTVDAVANQVVCNGAPTTAIAFTGAVNSSTLAFNWTNSNPSIGLPANGVGNIASFNAINTGNTPVTATITVTPTADGCTGASRSFTITVNPTPTVNAVSSQTLCNGSPTAAIAFTGAVSGTTFSWTNSAPSIGLAGSGTGNIASFTATNTGNTPVVANFVVTPSANGCTGSPINFSITVNPTPTVNAVPNQTLCNGIQTVPINFTGAVSGTTYSWTNNNATIGLAATGTGNIPGFNATNTGATPVTATITVTPSANGCTGTPRTFTITVNPTPVVTLAPLAAICGNAPAFTLTGGSPAGSGGIYFVNGVPQTSFNPANYTPGVQTVLYQFTNQFGCANTAVQNITVHPIPVTGFTVNNSGQCLQGNQFVFTNTTTGAATYVWNFGDATTSTAVNPSKSYTAAGTYTVTLTSTSVNGCVTTFSRQVTVYPQPAKPTVVPEFGNGIRSSVVENSYTWYRNGVLIPGSNSLYFYPQVAGYYQVQVTTSFGCSTRSDSLYYIPEKFFTAGLDRQFAFVYPIPAKDDVINVHFNIATRSAVNFTLYTLKGQILMTGVIPVGTRNYQIDVRRYPSATYVLRMTDVDNMIRGVVIPMMR